MEWAALQSRAAHDAGYLRAIDDLLTLEYENIAPPEEKIDA